MMVGMTYPLAQYVDSLTRALLATYVMVVERAVEESLGTPYGVLVWWDPADGIPRAEVNMKVPANTIAEHRGPLHTFEAPTHVRVNAQEEPWL